MDGVAQVSENGHGMVAEASGPCNRAMRSIGEVGWTGTINRLRV
jgi:hypothetical protein